MESSSLVPRIAVVLSTIGAFLLAVAVVAVLTSQVMAFETENLATTVPGGTTQFQDPDENLLMAPTNNETLPAPEGRHFRQRSDLGKHSSARTGNHVANHGRFGAI